MCLDVRAKSVIADGRRNRELRSDRTKAFRILIEVLCQARNFAVTDRRDTFYATLGMCDVKTTIKEEMTTIPDAVVVDYDKTLAEVYRDASLYLIRQRFTNDSLPTLWHVYKRGSLHEEGLSSWAVDWHTGLHTEDNIKTLAYHLMSNNQSLWMPLCGEPDVSPPQNDWHFPEPLPGQEGALEVKARALNRVVYISDRSCPLDLLLARRHGSSSNIAFWHILTSKSLTMFWNNLPEALQSHVEWTSTNLQTPSPFEEEANNDFALHNASGVANVPPGTQSRAGPGWRNLVAQLCIFHPRLEIDLPDFDPERDFGRLGLLDVGIGSQICILPAHARLGDVVVAVAPNMLPMLVRPLRPVNPPSVPLSPADPYTRKLEDSDSISLRLVQTLRTTEIVSISLMVGSILLLYAPAAAMFNQGKSAAGTVLASCFVAAMLASASVQGFHILKDLDAHVANVVTNRQGGKLVHILSILHAGAMALCAFFIAIGVISFRPQRDNLIGLYIASAFLFGTWIITGPLKWLLTFHRTIQTNLPRQRRRRALFAHLDDLEHTCGPEFAFIGPVIARQKLGDKYVTNAWSDPAAKSSVCKYHIFRLLLSLRRWLRPGTFPGFDPDLAALKDQVLSHLLSEVKENPAWDRPIQSFHLR